MLNVKKLKPSEGEDGNEYILNFHMEKDFLSLKHNRRNHKTKNQHTWLCKYLKCQFKNNKRQRTKREKYLQQIW